MFLLDNYDFLENLVKNGQARQEPFYKDGFCLADKKDNPNAVYVFRFDNGIIWAVYAYVNKKNRSFLKFHRSVEKLIFSFNMPIFRVGKNQDFKNHTRLIGECDNLPVFQYIKKEKNMGGGGSSARTQVYNDVDVTPVTTVSVDTEEIANAIKEASEGQIEVQEALFALKKADLTIEAQKTQFNILESAKKHQQLVLLVLLIGGTYAYSKMKKGKPIGKN